MPLGISGFTYAELHEPERLASLYERFCEEVRAKDAAFWAEWDEYRADPDAPRSPVAVSALLTRMAPHVSAFLERLFDVSGATSTVRSVTRDQDDLFRFKVDFVRRRALPLLKGGHVASSPADDAAVARLLAEVGASADAELAVAKAGCALLDREKTDKDAVAGDVEALKRWCAARIHDPAYREWVVFRFPENIEPWHLVPVQRTNAALPEQMLGPDGRLRRRDGFKLTDPRARGREVLSEIHYCVLCHERDKDSCSKGYKETAKGTAAVDATPKIAVNALGIELNGCPLDEKISEMHMLRKQGDAIGALALIVIDNPMCPGTGHRICNDCMKGCIYQKQEPVNIPQIETGVLTDVLKMPWGVEIYGLLTRWNPLNVRRPYALPYNGRNVLVRPAPVAEVAPPGLPRGRYRLGVVTSHLERPDFPGVPLLGTETRVDADAGSGEAILTAGGHLTLNWPGAARLGRVSTGETDVGPWPVRPWADACPDAPATARLSRVAPRSAEQGADAVIEYLETASGPLILGGPTRRVVRARFRR